MPCHQVMSTGMPAPHHGQAQAVQQYLQTVCGAYSLYRRAGKSGGSTERHAARLRAAQPSRARHRERPCSTESRRRRTGPCWAHFLQAQRIVPAARGVPRAARLAGGSRRMGQRAGRQAGGQAGEPADLRVASQRMARRPGRVRSFERADSLVWRVEGGGGAARRSSGLPHGAGGGAA